MNLGFFRNIFGGSNPHPAAAAHEEVQRIPRRSTGFQQFTRSILRPDGQKILDLGSTSNSNITFITGLGHKAYNEDVLAAAGHMALDFSGDDHGALDVMRFLSESLQYEPESFDAVILWDVCDYLPEPLVKPVIERIYRITKPQGVLLAFFHTRDAGSEAPFYRYHIQSEDTLELQPGPAFQLQRVFQNRHVESLFHDYASIKFFLGKENIREVLLVR